MKESAVGVVCGLDRAVNRSGLPPFGGLMAVAEGLELLLRAEIRF